MGSMPACGSPMLFAACHVLLRRLVPWHPPCALVRLILLRMTFVIVDPETNYNLLPSGSIATGLLRLFSSSLLLVRLSRCVGSFAAAQGPFQSLENDTELRQQFLLQDSSSSFALSRFLTNPSGSDRPMDEELLFRAALTP